MCILVFKRRQDGKEVVVIPWLDGDSDVLACAKVSESIAIVVLLISVKHWLLKHVTTA